MATSMSKNIIVPLKDKLNKQFYTKGEVDSLLSNLNISGSDESFSVETTRDTSGYVYITCSGYAYCFFTDLRGNTLKNLLVVPSGTQERLDLLFVEAKQETLTSTDYDDYPFVMFVSRDTGIVRIIMNRSPSPEGKTPPTRS